MSSLIGMMLSLNFNGILKARGSEIDPSVNLFFNDSYFVHNLNLSYQLSKEFSYQTGNVEYS